MIDCGHQEQDLSFVRGNPIIASSQRILVQNQVKLIRKACHHAHIQVVASPGADINDSQILFGIIPFACQSVCELCGKVGRQEKRNHTLGV